MASRPRSGPGRPGAQSSARPSPRPCRCRVRAAVGGGVTRREVSAGGGFRRGAGGDRKPGAACRLPGAECRRGRAGRVTARGGGPARPAGPRRGRRWRTTGAGLEGRTRGLALPGLHGPQGTVTCNSPKQKGAGVPTTGPQRAWNPPASRPSRPAPHGHPPLCWRPPPLDRGLYPARAPRLRSFTKARGSLPAAARAMPLARCRRWHYRSQPIRVNPPPKPNPFIQ